MFNIKSASPLVIAVSLLGYASSGLALEIIANEGIYKISNAGNHIPTSTALGGNTDDWACVYNAREGLIWEVKTTDGGLRDIKWNYSWLMTDPALNGGFAGVTNGGDCFGGKSCDTQNYVRQVNAEGLCGANDWRMPTQEELNTLSFNQDSLFQNFQNTDKTKGFWSSSTAANNVERAMLKLPLDYYSHLRDGHKSDLHGVMLVRNGDINLSNFNETLEYKNNPSEKWDFKYPRSIHLAPDETLLVADSVNHRIVNLKQDGTIIRSFGHFGKDSPSSILFAPDGTLYANDLGNKRIQHFKMDGTLISESAPEGYPILGLKAVAADGSSFMISDEGSVQHRKANGEIIWEKQYRYLSSSPYGTNRDVSSISLAMNGTLFVQSYSTRSGTLSFSDIYEHFKADGALIGSSSRSCSFWLGYQRPICSDATGDQAAETADKFASDFAITKEGTKFSIDYGAIHKYIPTADYIYYGGSAPLGKNFAVFENITVSNEHYWVQLQDQGGYQFKVLKAYPIKPAVENNTSVYNPFTGLLTLPKVTAYGVDYQVVMQRLDNGLFGVKSAELLPK